MKDALVIALLALALLICSGGCQSTVIQKGDLRITETTLLIRRSRSFDGAEYGSQKDGSTVFRLQGAKGASEPATEVLKAAADAVRAAR